MGKLSCKRCGAVAEASTQAEADVLIDHGLGIRIGRPCSGKQSDLVWGGSSTATNTARTVSVTTDDIPSPQKSKKSKKGR